VNRSITPARTAPAAVVAILALAGCGGSSSSSSSAAGANFVTRANQICTSINKQVAALPAIKTTTDIVTTGPKEVNLARQGVTELKALTPPSDKKDTANQYVATLDQETALSAKLITAIKAGDAVEVKKIVAQGKSSSARTHARAIKLGLTQCAKNVQPGSTG
jgi:ABC-type glycerol-3-phosphate transport system substrate-binding protein